MTVTVQEIVEALWVGQQYAEEAHMNPNNSFNKLIARIEREGIAPPDGYAIVPIEPTEEMLDWMGIEADSYEQDKRHYKAMLAVAPKPEDL